jgi:hypothetical protein
MKAKIYKPVKSAMQSGGAGLDQWVLEYELQTPRRPEDLMGWTSSGDTLNQVQVRFPSREAAVAFAEGNGLEYTVAPEHRKTIRPRSYLDNFKFRAAADEA